MDGQTSLGHPVGLPQAGSPEADSESVTRARDSLVGRRFLAVGGRPRKGGEASPWAQTPWRSGSPHPWVLRSHPQSRTGLLLRT